jgi:hypothetical protein
MVAGILTKKDELQICQNIFSSGTAGLKYLPQGYRGKVIFPSAGA